MLLNRPRIIAPLVFSKWVVALLFFNRKIKRTFVRILEIVNVFAKSHATLRAHHSWCKVSSCDLCSNFRAQRLRSWGSHFRITPRDGPFLSRIFFWCQVPLENLTPCFDPNFLSSRRIDLLGQESWDTQPTCVDSFNKATDPLAPSFFDFLLGFSSASTCLKNHFLPKMLVVLTHGRMPKSTWRVFTIFVTARNFAPVVWRAFLSHCSWGFFSPFVSLGLRNLVREKTIVLFVSDHCTSLLVLVCHDGNHMSLLLNIVHVPSTENNLPLSSPRWLSFFPFWLVVTDPLSTISFWALTLRVLIIWSIWSFTDVFKRK